MIRLDICSVNISTHIDLTDSERESRKDRPVIRFDVFPNDFSYIELETGETFGNGTRGKQRDEDSIECQVALYVSSEQREPSLYYHGGISDDIEPIGSSLSIHIPLIPSELDFIVKNIQSGIFPVTMEIDWKTNYFTIDDGEGGLKEPDNIIDYGWEPDGSHQIWKNAKKENREIKLSSVNFSYSPLPATRNDENYLLEIPRAQNASQTMTSELSLLRQCIEGNFEKLRKSSAYILVLVVIVSLVHYLK